MSPVKAIGPAFPDELKVAGLLGLAFSWGADGVFQFSPGMLQAQIDAVLAVYAAHDPLKPAAPTQQGLDLADVKAKIDVLIADGTIPVKIKDFVTALKKVLT